MRVLITGATGLIGRAICTQLAAAGHELSALSTDPDSARRRVPELGAAFPWAAGTLDPPVAAFDVDAVLHLAGETVVGRWTKAKRARIFDSRQLGTRQVVAGMREAGCRQLVSASAVGFYGDRGDERCAEDAEPGQGFLPTVCAAWEQEARAAEDFARVLRLRIGLLLDPEGGVLGETLPLARLGLNGPLGGGQQWWPWIHRDDLLGLLQLALEGDAAGAWNVTAPEPARQREVAQALGRVLGRPAFLPAPAWGLRLVLGGFADEPLISRRALPEGPLAAGYRYRFTELEAALRDLITG